MTGLAYMQAMLAGEVSAPVISGLLDYRPVAVEAGHTAFAGTPGFAHANVGGGTHGGWYCAILDSAMTCALISRLPAGKGCTTLDLSVRMIRPIPLGAEVTATGTAAHAGRRTAVATGEIRDARGRLCATGSTTALVIDLP